MRATLFCAVLRLPLVFAVPRSVSHLFRLRRCLKFGWKPERRDGNLICGKILTKLLQDTNFVETTAIFLGPKRPCSGVKCRCEVISACTNARKTQGAIYYWKMKKIKLPTSLLLISTFFFSLYSVCRGTCHYGVIYTISVLARRLPLGRCKWGKNWGWFMGCMQMLA